MIKASITTPVLILTVCVGFIFTLAIWATPTKLVAPIPCIASPCQFATNIAWDTSGKPDTRPNTWGDTDVVQSQIPFVNVPAGYVVSITHVSGDEIAAPRGTVNPNSMAYALIGLTNSSPYQSPYVGPGLGSAGTFIYKQTPIGPSGARIPINENVSGTLNADNIAIIKQALFLDTMGVPEHFEATLLLDFVYVPAPPPAIAARPEK